MKKIEKLENYYGGRDMNGCHVLAGVALAGAFFGQPWGAIAFMAFCLY